LANIKASSPNMLLKYGVRRWCKHTKTDEYVHIATREYVHFHYMFV